MTVEEALIILDVVLEQKPLNNVQELVFRHTWEGQTYAKIAQRSGYDTDYIKYVGFQLWHLLSEVFGERVNKSNVQSVLRRSVQSTQILTSSLNAVDTSITSQQLIRNRTDWEEAVDVSVFYGRHEELATLEQWIVDEHCRLVALLGMGGIGKTTLAMKLAEQIQNKFEYLIWRSLHNAPPVKDILTELILFLSNQQEADLPETLEGQLSQLMRYLRSSRCLLILDNAESVLRSGECAGHYREGYEGYGELLRRVAEASHPSCLVLTSREKPRELALLEGETLPVRSVKLTGLKEIEGRKIFQAKGSFSGSEDEWRALIKHYGGNPLALKMIASSIQYFFDSIAEVLELLDQGTLVFDDVRNILEQQFNRLSEPEKEIMYWLAINREPVLFERLQTNFIPKTSRSELLKNLASLERRSLIEKSSKGFTQQPVVMEYMTERLINQAHQEPITENTRLLTGLL